MYHEHGDFVLHAMEEHATEVHAVALSFASTSVLHTTCYGNDIDVGLKIRRPLELLEKPLQYPIHLLDLVHTAEERDAGRVLLLHHGHKEDRLLRLKRDYLRLYEWLHFHPDVIVPIEIFSTVTH